ncbi:hypothetical protein [Luteitalea sp.]|jgi:hypothetical protein|uniref:hypothetical protein n=1 Tax=Luteitalea sp. TaxID=2004800 RepID=UPI0025BC09E9|nr:hypothetical protein [Luteitalea sp.]
MRSLLFLAFGALVVGSSAMADMRGWLATKPAVVRNVPRSIRDNPGAYRSLYNGAPRFFGGK